VLVRASAAGLVRLTAAGALAALFRRARYSDHARRLKQTGPRHFARSMNSRPTWPIMACMLRISVKHHATTEPGSGHADPA
jgi:hypothetical protein